MTMEKSGTSFSEYYLGRKGLLRLVPLPLFYSASHPPSLCYPTSHSFSFSFFLLVLIRLLMLPFGPRTVGIWLS